ncbi:hypothetical protein ACTA71_001850 [Dictyostelium dimigraforme]
MNSKVFNSPRPLTLLLLGESGIGKSTFVNSFANYSLYSSFEEARANELQVLISSKFRLFVNGKEEVISVNEKTEPQMMGKNKSIEVCRTFKFPEVGITIIDTPGIGDTRGILQDMSNLESITKYISKFNKIDGICILLHPASRRLNISNIYNFKSLLSMFDKSAARNIVFCYTHSRYDFYSPGDSYQMVKRMVESLNVPDLKFNKDNIFCFDNEPFKYLVALKNGITFTDYQIDDFSTSWNVSIQSTQRLISFLNLIPSRDIGNIVLLNDSRILIKTLIKSINDIKENLDIIRLKEIKYYLMEEKMEVNLTKLYEEDLLKEKDNTTRHVSLLLFFLSQYSITSGSNVAKDYLDLCIRNEKFKSVELLEFDKLSCTYSFLEKDLNKQQFQTITANDILILIKKLKIIEIKDLIL